MVAKSIEVIAPEEPISEKPLWVPESDAAATHPMVGNHPLYNGTPRFSGGMMKIAGLPLDEIEEISE